MTTLYSETEAEFYDPWNALHLARMWFADIQLPSQRLRLSNSYGPHTIGGHVWTGISDPDIGPLVSVTDMQEVWFGTAPAVAIILGAGNLAFLKSVWTEANVGTPVDIYFAIVDAESGVELHPLKLMFQGKITGVNFERGDGLVSSAVAVRVGSWEESLNYPAIKTDWSPEGQRARYPGDLGLDFIGASVKIKYKGGAPSL